MLTWICSTSLTSSCTSCCSRWYRCWGVSLAPRPSPSCRERNRGVRRGLTACPRTRHPGQEVVGRMLVPNSPQCLPIPAQKGKKRD